LRGLLKSLVLLLGISGWLFAVLSIGRVWAAQEAPYFTNQDVERYREPSDKSGSAPKLSETGTRKEAAARSQQRKEAESWCRKAGHCRKRIEKDQEDVQELEKALDDLKDAKGKKRTSIEKKLAKTRKHLRNSEKDLAELEDEAHRKGIPPGWLRCQFE
jgi:hypothetical protein